MFAILSAGIAPTLALMAFFYLKERFDSEPISTVLRTFCYGALLVFPIMFIQYAFTVEGIGQSPFINSFLITGFSEEFFKWFILLYTIYKYTTFKSLYDGILYGVSISLGFATIENLLYLLSNGIEYAIGRAIFPVSSHALFGVIMGYYLGKAKFQKKYRALLIMMALFIPIALHGTYDYILEIIPSHWIYVLVPFMILLWILGLRKVKIASRHSSEYVILMADNKTHAQ